MPSFTAQLANLKANGPIIEVLIAPSRRLVEVMQRRKQTPPQPVKTMAMIDTGASSTVVSPGIIEQLNIAAIGAVKISTPSDRDVSCLQYEATIIFPSRVAIATSELIAAPLEGQPLKCLIGRDVLRDSVFIYNGYAQTITLSY
jgi:predicted aspartyl protease